MLLPRRSCAPDLSHGVSMMDRAHTRGNPAKRRSENRDYGGQRTTHAPHRPVPARPHPGGGLPREAAARKPAGQAHLPSAMRGRPPGAGPSSVHCGLRLAQRQGGGATPRGDVLNRSRRVGSLCARAQADGRHGGHSLAREAESAARSARRHGGRRQRGGGCCGPSIPPPNPPNFPVLA